MIKITILCFAMIFTQCLTLASPQDAGREAAALPMRWRSPDFGARQ
jgi:hypothetical protein